MTKEEAIKVIRHMAYLSAHVVENGVEAYEYIEQLLSQFSLPSNLDEAANSYSSKTECAVVACRGFKAGAEWMAGQGYVEECTVRRTPLNGPAGICMNLYECDGFKLGDRVIVQIRKK